MENKIIKKQSEEQIAQKWLLSFAELRINTFADCFPTEQNKTLKSIIRAENDKPAKMVIYAEFAKMAMDFNITNNLSELQIKNLVNDIFEFYQHLTMRDLKYFIQKIKLGQFGKNFNRIDAPLIFGYLNEYQNERLIEVERSNDDYKSGVNILADPNILKHLAPLFKSVQQEVKPKTELQLKAEQEVRLKIKNQQAVFAKIHNEFCKLHARQGGEQGVMFVNYAGKKMDFEEYFNEVNKENYE